MTLLFSLAGRQAFALCLADDHRAIEVVGHAPCGTAAQWDGDAIAEASPCVDMAVGSVLEASRQYRDTAHAANPPTEGGTAVDPVTRMPWPRGLNTRWRTATILRDHRLQSLRTVVLLI